MLLVVGAIVKYVVPGKQPQAGRHPRPDPVDRGRRARSSGSSWCRWSGIFLGFVLGVYLAERHRIGRDAQALAVDEARAPAVGLSILIELAAGVLATLCWVVGVVAT